MVGVDVGVEHAGDPPVAPFRQPEVHLGLQGSVYDHGLAVGPDDVGQTPLTGAAHLHHLGTRPGHLGRVPGEAPGLHPAFEGVRLVALATQLLRGHRARTATPADGDHGNTLGQFKPLHCPLVARMQGVVGVEVQASRYGPLRAVLTPANVHDRDPLAALEHDPQGRHIYVAFRQVQCPSSPPRASRPPASRAALAAACRPGSRAT